VLAAVGLFLFGLLFLSRTTPLWPDTDLAEEAAAEEAATHWITVALIVVALLVYPFLLAPLGYTVATALFFPVVSRMMGSRRIVRDVLVGIGLGVVIYVTFTQFLGVRLPAGLLRGLL
jgi:putative tricarboxylic transport membrane protein